MPLNLQSIVGTNISRALFHLGRAAMAIYFQGTNLIPVPFIYI